MDHIPNHFRLPARSESRGLRHRIIQTNIKLAVDGFLVFGFRFPFFPVVKRDNVCGTFVPEKLPVHPRHFLRSDQGNTEFYFCDF